MRVLVVDDHPLIRVGLRHALGDLHEAELDILEAGTCRDALSVAAEYPDLDLVLLDLNLPDASGVDGLDQFSRRFPDLPVLVISSFDDHATMETVLRRGAAGYVPKTCLNQVLVLAVKLVMAGGVYVPPEILMRPATWAGATIDPRLPVQWPARTADTST
jgi:DNA-binding NarL/FixJ family response regulator